MKAMIASLALAVGLLHADAASLALEEGFARPPQAAHPLIWWHWMDGNISKKGITTDLEAMKQVGIAGVQIFQLGHGIPSGPVTIFTDEWYDHLRFAAEECLRLDLDLTLANCPGWTSSGGPWVTLEDSMKKFVFSTWQGEGGACATVARPDLTVSPIATARTKNDFYRDVATVAFPTPAQEKNPVDPKTIVDLTARLHPDGSVDWQVPAGKWTVLRFGYTTTGQKCFPAPSEGAGLEVDKLSVAAVARHFDAYIGKILERLGPAAKAVRGVLIDSYEVGPFSWTQGFEKDYQARWQIDPKELYLVLSGYCVETAQRTAKIDHQFKRLRADMFAQNYAGTMQRKANERGLKLWLEPYSTRVGEDLQYGRYCDVPMGEFWPDNPGSLRRAHTRNFASSIAHFWGRPLVGAESFSVAPASHAVSKWRWGPLHMKVAGDRAFSVGVNKMSLHGAVQQPWLDVDGPGMTMGPWGMRFDRTEPWWRCTRPFFGYLARCQWMLQAGRPVVDMLVYNGDCLPSVLVDFSERRYLWDACTVEGWKMLRKEGDAYVSPGGTRYRILVRDCHQKIDYAGVEPDFLCDDERILWTHRAYEDGSEAYFVSAQTTNEGEIVTTDISFRQKGRAPELWYPETGEIRKPAAWRAAEGRTRVTLRMEAAESVFVVFRTAATKGIKPVRPVYRGKPLKLDWKLAFPGRAPKKIDCLFDWSTSTDDAIRYFTGTAVYTADLGDFPGGDVDFGKVRDFAEVFVDGRAIVTLWKPPYRCTLPKGRTLEVRVVNGWPNRLIGDERTRKPDSGWRPGTGSWLKDSGDCMTQPIPSWVWEEKPSPNGRAFATWRHWRAEAQLLPAGLIGPVTTMSGE